MASLAKHEWEASAETAYQSAEREKSLAIYYWRLFVYKTMLT